MKLKDIKEQLDGNADVVSVRHGIYTVKKSYYWGATKDGSELVNAVKSLFNNIIIVDFGNHYHGFVGGAKPGSYNDSYFYCKFKFTNQ
jgi:hypothetical protein